MRVPSRSLRPLLALVLALSSLTPRLLAQKGEPQPHVPARIVAAQAFLASVYPDLDLNSAAATFRVDGERVLIAVSPRPAGPTRKIVEVVPLVVASVEFDASGRLLNFAADGVYLEQARNKSFSDALREHPDWTDGDAEVWLQQNAGRRVVGRTFVPTVSLGAKNVTDLFGGRIVSESPQFKWRSPGKAGQAARFMGKPGWIVPVVVTTETGAAVSYELEFEPIGERLVRVTRR